MIEVAYADGSRRKLPDRDEAAQARRDYVEGRIEIDEFEARVAKALTDEQTARETPFSDINPRYAWIGLFDGKLHPVSERVRRLFIGDDAQLSGPLHLFCKRRPEYVAVAPTETSHVVYGHERVPNVPAAWQGGYFVIEALAEEWATVDWGIMEDELRREGKMGEARCEALLGRAAPFPP